MIAQDNPSIPSLQYNVLDVYSEFIWRLDRRGLNNEAIAAIREAQEWIERLPRQGGEKLFVLACARARCSEWLSHQGIRSQTTEERNAGVHEADLAMYALRQAVAAGFLELDRLDQAHELDRLRSRPDFKALVSTLRSTASQGTSADVSKVKLGPSNARPGEQGRADTVRSVLSRVNQAAEWYEIGLALLVLGRLDAAAEHLEQALAVRRQLVAEEPARLDYQFDLAATMVALSEHARKACLAERARQWSGKALPMLTRAVAQRPTDRLAWQLLGLAHAGLGQPEEAAAAFARLMELVPQAKYEDLWWDPGPAPIGELLAPYDEIFARVVQMRPTDKILLIARFHYFGRRRRWREAADIVARIIELDPDDSQARAYRRNLLYHLGDFEGYQWELRRELSSAGAADQRNPGGDHDVRPERPTDPRSLAAAANREGRYAEAIRDFEASNRSHRPPLLSGPESYRARHGAPEAGAVRRGPAGAGGIAEAGR